VNKLLLIIASALLYSCSIYKPTTGKPAKQEIHNDTTSIFRKERNNLFSIKTTPISLINIIDDPSARLGLESKIYRNLSLYMEAGTYFSYRKTGINSGSQGYLLNPELRLYANRNGETTGPYIGLDYRYKNRSFNWVDTFYYKQATIPFYYRQDFRIHTITNSFKLKAGNVAVAGPLLIEVFAGIGIKFRNTVSNLTSEEEKQFNYNAYSTFYMYKSRRGNFVSPDLMIGIRLGFCFK